jgi:hypothetical protein
MKIIIAIVTISVATLSSVLAFTLPARTVLLSNIRTEMFSTEPEKQDEDGLDLNLEEMFDM